MLSKTAVSKWKTCRREIIRKHVAFCAVEDGCWYLSTAPEKFFTPMKEIDLSRHSINTQEQLFVRDLFLIYTGCQGENIRFVLSKDSVEWTVNPSGEESLRARLYTEGGLQLAALLIILQHYITAIANDLSRGRVALSIAVMAGEFFRNEVLATVRSLEMEMRNGNQMLNIFTVTTRMRPFLQTVKELVVVFSNIYKRELIGGEILSYLSDQARLCVLPNTTSLLLKLERGGLKQYLHLVFSWICYGSLLEDYYREFMVWDLDKAGCFTKREVLEDEELEKTINTFDGLEERFCVVSALCPKQLQDVFMDIVNCGKYMRIIQKLDVDKDDFGDTFSDGSILQNWQDKLTEDIQRDIKEIRSKISQLLVLQLRKSFKMEMLLEALHGFFFLGYSDWLNQFFDLTENILPHPVDNAMAKKVQFYFEEAVNASCLKTFGFRNLFQISFDKCDVFTLFRSIANLTPPSASQEVTTIPNETSLTAEQLSTALQGYRMENQLRDGLVGAAALSLNVDLKSPLTLMFPFRMLLNYELVFRTLFCLHRTLHLLYGKLLLEDLLGEERAMLQSMLHVLNGYLSHCVSSVIPNLSKTFLSKIAKSATLEEILGHHTFLFDQLFEKCFFADTEFMNNLCEVIEIVIGYSTDVHPFDRTAFQWKTVREKLNGILIRRSNNNSYAQLHIRLFSRIC